MFTRIRQPLQHRHCALLACREAREEDYIVTQNRGTEYRGSAQRSSRRTTLDSFSYTSTSQNVTTLLQTRKVRSHLLGQASTDMFRPALRRMWGLWRVVWCGTISFNSQIHIRHARYNGIKTHAAGNYCLTRQTMSVNALNGQTSCVRFRHESFEKLGRSNCLHLNT